MMAILLLHRSSGAITLEAGSADEYAGIKIAPLVASSAQPQPASVDRNGSTARLYGTIVSRRAGKDWRRVMSWSEILGKTATGLGVVAVPVVLAVAGAGQASADPGICFSGPWGNASACINGPGWVDWTPHWNGGWDNWGHGWGNGDDQGEDD
jgi:hypothetical protein